VLRALKQWFAGPRRSPRRRESFRPSLEAFEDRLVPSTLTVTCASDNGSSGTLRCEVNQANKDAAKGKSDTIVFSRKLAGDTIVLTQGDLELKAGKNGATVTINGAKISAVSGNDRSTLFLIDTGAHVTLENLQIEYGSAAYGGGVENNGNLVLNNCTLYDNTASQQGGGIYNGGTGTLEVLSCSFESDSASGYGGAIMNWGNLQEASNCSFYINNAGIGGGGIFNDSGSAYLSDCSFDYTSAGDYGGGVANYGNLTAVSCSFFSSSAGSYGGAIFNGHGQPITLTNLSWSGDQAPNGPDFFQS
jgi:hypothetical protein